MTQGKKTLPVNSVDHIGFVLDPAATLEESLRAVCIHFKGQSTQWNTYGIGTPQGAFYKYGYCLLVMAILTRRKLCSENAPMGYRARNPVEIAAEPPCGSDIMGSSYLWIIGYYYNVTKTKPNEYRGIPSELRQRMRSLFETQRLCNEGTIRRSIQFAGMDGDRLHFWKTTDFPNGMFDSAGTKIPIPQDTLPTTSIPDDSLRGVLNGICSSPLWSKWRGSAVAKKSQLQGAHDDMEKIIRDYLQDQARGFLSRRLHERDDYQLIEMEAGRVHRSSWLLRQVASERQQDQSREWEPFNWHSLFDSQEIFVLSAELGSGKTTFLRHFQKTLLDRGGRIPIYLHASQLKKRYLRDKESLACGLVNFLPPSISRNKAADFLKRQIGNNVVLLIDGLDQIRGVGTAYEHLLDSLFGVVPRNVIVASRPSAVTSYEDDSRVVFLRLKSFDSVMQKRYFGTGFDRALQVCRCDQEMLGLPILAFLVRTVVEHGQEQDVTSRTGLYRQFLNYFFQRCRHDGVSLSRDLRIQIRRALQKISYEALRSENIEPQKVPLDLCQQCILDLGLRIQVDDLPRCGVVSFTASRTSRDPEYLQYDHQSLQEYCAAEWASRDDERINYILGLYWDPRWKDVIKYLAGIVGDSLIDRLYPDRGHDNVIHSRLFLAAECACQTQVAEETRNRLVRDVTALTRKRPLNTVAVAALFDIGASDAQEIAWRAVTGEGGYHLFHTLRCFHPTVLECLFSTERCAELVQVMIDNIEEDYSWLLQWWVDRISTRDISRLIDTLPSRVQHQPAVDVRHVIFSRGSRLTRCQVKKLLSMAESKRPLLRGAAILSLPPEAIKKQDVPKIMHLIKRDKTLQRYMAAVLIAIPRGVLTESQVALLTKTFMTECSYRVLTDGTLPVHQDSVEHLRRTELDQIREHLHRRLTRDTVLVMLRGLSDKLTRSEISRILDSIDYKTDRQCGIPTDVLIEHPLGSGQVCRILDAVGKAHGLARNRAMGSVRQVPHHLFSEDLEAMMAGANSRWGIDDAVAAIHCAGGNHLRSDDIWRILRTFCRDIPASLVCGCGFVKHLASVLDSEQNHFVVSEVAKCSVAYAAHMLTAINVKTLRKEDLDVIVQLWQDGRDYPYDVYRKLLECHSVGLLK